MNFLESTTRVTRVGVLIVAAAAFLAVSCSHNTEPAKIEKVPEIYKVNFDTSKGTFVIEVHRDWAPMGADRFYELVKSKFFDGDRFFRVIKGFIVQFGINGDPKVTAKWRGTEIVDDPVKETNARGTITFAKTGAPNSRTTQMFINLAANPRLDGMGFAPFGKVIEGMDVVDQLFSQYGEGAPSGGGPDQQLIEARGNQYLEGQFGRLDYIKTAKIE